ncbi:MAG: class IV adenylate cyclase [Candidatus Thorarchaeota archaeon]
MGDIYEVEVKIAIDNYEEMEKRIMEVGAQKTNRETQIDSYYDHPCKTFQNTDEALRVRSRQPINSGAVDPPREEAELTYKGPRIDSTTKTRIETSVSIDSAKGMTSILENLGFKLVASIIKKRQFFNLPSMTISIDEVEDVGLFMELETIAQTKDVDEARQNIFAMMEKLGLNPSQSIRASYLEIYMNR